MLQSRTKFRVLLILILNVWRIVFSMQGGFATIRDRHRSRVLACAERDPCAYRGIWFSLTLEEKNIARRTCAAAYESFTRLTSQEQENCLNARDPECRAGFHTSDLFYSCTFCCEVEPSGSRGEEEGQFYRVTRSHTQRKNITSIAIGKVLEPTTIPIPGPGVQPYNPLRHRVLPRRN